ncbi:hypothetical protein KI387_004291, partial [Taxus chinensis]
MAEDKHLSQLNVGQSKQPLGQPSEEQQTKLFEVNTAPLRTWADVVGLSGEDAKQKIESENRGLRVVIVPESSFLTADYNRNRVR